MGSEEYLERCPGDEGFAAALAGVLGSPGRLVQLLVGAPVSSLGELATTVSARKRTLPRVDTAVLHQQLSPGETLAAVFTTMTLPIHHPCRYQSESIQVSRHYIFKILSLLYDTTALQELDRPLMRVSLSTYSRYRF